MGSLPGEITSPRPRLPLRVLSHGVLVCFCCAFLLPLAWMIFTSLQPSAAHEGAGLIPHPPMPQNYLRVLHHPRFDFLTLAHNTLVISLLSVLGNTLSSALAAYAFAKIRFKGRGLLFFCMLATMMVPFPVTMIAIFSIFHFLDVHTPIQFLGTFKPLWLPAWFGSAFSIFLLRQFFMTIPDELSEAARLDGCSEWGIFVRIILPLARPALAVVALFTFMAAWNDYLAPLLYLQRPDQYTLALGLQAFQSQHGGTEWNLLMAASLMVIAPVVVLFFLTQKTFIQGIATTGMKG